MRNGIRYQSICRVCRSVTATISREWYRVAPPRCTACGGMLDRGHRGRSTKPSKDRKPTSAIEAQLLVVQHDAKRHQIEVRWNRIKVRGRSKKPIFHVLFDHAGYRLLDYWPSNDTARANGISTKVVGAKGALEMAIQLAAQKNSDMSQFHAV